MCASVSVCATVNSGSEGAIKVTKVDTNANNLITACAYTHTYTPTLGHTNPFRMTSAISFALISGSPIVSKATLRIWTRGAPPIISVQYSQLETQN